MDLLAQSPFINDVQNKLKLKHKIQIMFMSFTVAPVRLLCLFLCVFVASPLARFVVHNQDVRNKPISGWRKLLYYPIRLFSRGVYFCGALQWIRVYGKPDMSVPIMTCAPHFSFLDTLLFVYLNFPSAVGRAGSEEVPLFGPLVKICQPIIVNRDQYSSRTDTVHRLIDRVKSNLRWPPTLLFVEGTTTNGTALIKFKPGAFIPGLPVQPVCLRYICASSYDSITWGWKGPSVYKLVWLQLCQLHTTVEFHFLPVYKPSEEEKKDANLYAENVRQLMSSYMKLPVSDYSYEDAKLMTKVAEHHLPCGVGLIKLQNLRKKYNIANFEDVFDLIPLFAKVADKESGVCYVGQFANNLGLKDSTKVDKLFELFDTDKKGNFTFAQFVDTYCQSMQEMFNNQNINTSLDKVLNSLEKFKNDNASSSSSYTFEQLNAEFKQLFNLELLSPDKLDLGNQRVINKRALENHFRVNKLHLYLFTTVIA